MSNRQSQRIGAALVVAAACSSLAAAEVAQVETTIGVEGVYYVRRAEGRLAARAVDENSPLVLRLAGETRDSDDTLYELRYIAARPGEHDLRDYLIVSGGPPLPPLVVSVRGLLPPDDDGTLGAWPASTSGFSWPYRLTLSGLFLAWGVFTIALVLQRLLRRRARSVPPPTVTLSLADKLRPLVEAALAGRLAPAGQACLESLLVAHWRDELKLATFAPAEALRKMRSHERAGRLLRELERWLHERPGAHQVDVAELLGPYRAELPRAESPLAAGDAA